MLPLSKSIDIWVRRGKEFFSFADIPQYSSRIFPSKLRVMTFLFSSLFIIRLKQDLFASRVYHYDDVTTTAMASQITSLMIVYSTVYSGAYQRKHQSSASLAFVWGIHRDRWIPRTKDQLRGKCFHLMTSSCDRISFIFHWRLETRGLPRTSLWLWEIPHWLMFISSCWEWIRYCS